MLGVIPLEKQINSTISNQLMQMLPKIFRISDACEYFQFSIGKGLIHFLGFLQVVGVSNGR